MSDKITFVFPAKTEYIGAIRLAVSGVASSFDFDVGKIEDIKSCVAEACLLLMCAQTCETFSIFLECDGELKAKVGAAGAVKVLPCEDCMEFNSEMSRIMIEALSKNVSFVRQGKVLKEVYFEIKHDAEA